MPDTQVYDNVECASSSQTDIDSKFSDILWNTPPRGTSRWKDGFQDMNVLVGYPQLKYNSDQTQCTVTVQSVLSELYFN